MQSASEQSIPAENLTFLEPLHREMVQALAGATCRYYGMDYPTLMQHSSHLVTGRRGMLFYLVMATTGLSSYQLMLVFGRSRTGMDNISRSIARQLTVDRSIQADARAIADMANASVKTYDWQVSDVVPAKKRPAKQQAF